MTTERSASDRWLLRQPTDLPMRLFCFPHAGAGASAYGSWAGALAGAGVDVCPVQLPGRENRFREPRHHRLEPLLEALVSALQRHLDRPYALFGHSLGALLAYELARFLSGVGVGPDRLLVSGRIAPQLSDPRPPMHASSRRGAGREAARARWDPRRRAGESRAPRPAAAHPSRRPVGERDLPPRPRASPGRPGDRLRRRPGPQGRGGRAARVETHDAGGFPRIVVARRPLLRRPEPRPAARGAGHGPCALARASGPDEADPR